jgi:hypothetical protein
MIRPPWRLLPHDPDRPPTPPKVNLGKAGCPSPVGFRSLPLYCKTLKMEETHARNASLASRRPHRLVAGTYLVITHLVLLFVVNRGDVRSMVADPLYQVASVAYAAAFAGLLIALFAAYARQALEAGTFGLAALFAAIVGTFTLGADMWFEDL